MSIPIKVDNLTLSYRQKPVVEHVSFELPNGSLTAIVGPNGGGKTTLIKGMLGLLPKDTGKVSFGDLNLKQARKQIAYVPQKGNVNWDFPTTVLDVAVMGRYVHLGWIKRPKASDIALAKDCLNKLGMSDYWDRQISELSGGQRQRVFLARALVQEPEILILDEPLQGVDILTEHKIIDILKQLQQTGKTILVVHHNIYNVASIFDRVILLNRQLIASGPVNSVMTSQNLELAYGEDISQNMALTSPVEVSH